MIGAGLLVGAAVSFGYAAMPAVIMASVPHHQSGIANGINSISRSTGSAIGSAIVTTILASKTIEHLPGGRARAARRSQFTLTFGIAAVALLLAAAVALLGLSKHHRRSPRPSRWPRAAPSRRPRPPPPSSDAHDATLPAVAETSAEQRQP